MVCEGKKEKGRKKREEKLLKCRRDDDREGITREMMCGKRRAIPRKRKTETERWKRQQKDTRRKWKRRREQRKLERVMRRGGEKRGGTAPNVPSCGLVDWALADVTVWS